MRLEKWNEKDQDVFPEENVGLFTDETGDRRQETGENVGLVTDETG